MYKSNEERLTDIIIGEATLELLLSDKAVSSRALMDVLQRMVAEESDDERQQVILRAINEVQQNLNSQSNQSRVTLRDRNHNEHHFNGDAVPDNKRRH